MKEEKDFYFSAKHSEHVRTLWSQNSRHKRPTYFKGKMFTECITKGKEPLSNHFGDLVFLGTGTYDDITVKA